ncbi:Rubrerythrin [Candidatus Methanoperedenaceae archaeon GB50]|nr:Rubrerythrin [Candidatus Methanoperedenaceae archaeon GB50]CAD7772267.1 MAG: Rubrerythrin [Candidatus Methanoperedenaceae archaeon GB50]
MGNNKERIEALKTAIKLEEDGRAFYLKASEKAVQSFAKEMFKSLAEAENKHLKVVKTVYERLQKEGDWPKLVIPSGDQKTATVFPEEVGMSEEELSESVKVLDIAIGMEEESIKLYDGLTERAVDPFEKRFYIVLSNEERDHYLDLSDYRDYLQDPTGWFATREGFMLDGI